MHDFERRAWVEYVISISKPLFGRFCCQHLLAACQVEIQASPVWPQDVNMPAAPDGGAVSWPLGWPMWDWSCCKLPREALHFIGKLPREALHLLAICYFFDVAGFWEKCPMIMHLRNRRMAHVPSSFCMMGAWIWLLFLTVMSWLMHHRWRSRWSQRPLGFKVIQVSAKWLSPGMLDSAFDI